MAQPVMDTLRLSKNLREAGIAGEHADGMAQAFGAELDEHVAVRKDLDAGFEGVRSDMALMRSELSSRIDALDAKFNVLSLGIGLALAFLGVMVGIVGVGVYRQPDAVPAPAPVVIPVWPGMPTTPASIENGGPTHERPPP